jgi:Protein of unknown function (DUF4058)
MSSPFPGMDPYLEHPAFWRDFHHTFVGCWREAIAEQLPDSYEARLDETVNLVHMDEATKKIYPDVAVTRKRRTPRSKSKPAGTLLLEPVTIPHEYLDEERQGQIKIVHRPDRTLVAVLELLSPTNKNGDGFEEYRGKRRAVLEQDVHLVELDLLLAGNHPPLARPLPDGDYYLFVSRAGERPNCDVYDWKVRDPLPTMPIPLQAPDKDVHVDLAKVFATTYQRGRYARSLYYEEPPPVPMKQADVRWATRLSASKKRRT